MISITFIFLFLKFIWIRSESRWRDTCCNEEGIGNCSDISWISLNHSSSQNTEDLSVSLITYYTDNIEEYTKWNYGIMYGYSEFHNYNMFVLNPDTGHDFELNDPRWNKIQILRIAIDHISKDNEYFIWFDADFTMLDIDYKFENIIEEFNWADIIIAKDSSPESGMVNTGCIIVKASDWSRNFLDKWWSTFDRSQVSEQGAFSRLAHDPSVTSKALDMWMHVALLPPAALNSIFDAWVYQQPGDHFLHLAGAHDVYRRGVFRYGWQMMCSQATANDKSSGNQSNYIVPYDQWLQKSNFLHAWSHFKRSSRGPDGSSKSHLVYPPKYTFIDRCNIPVTPLMNWQARIETTMFNGEFTSNEKVDDDDDDDVDPVSQKSSDVGLSVGLHKGVLQVLRHVTARQIVNRLLWTIEEHAEDGSDVLDMGHLLLISSGMRSDLQDALQMGYSTSSGANSMHDLEDLLFRASNAIANISDANMPWVYPNSDSDADDKESIRLWLQDCDVDESEVVIDILQWVFARLITAARSINPNFDTSHPNHESERLLSHVEGEVLQQAVETGFQILQFQFSSESNSNSSRRTSRSSTADHTDAETTSRIITNTNINEATESMLVNLRNMLLRLQRHTPASTAGYAMLMYYAYKLCEFEVVHYSQQIALVESRMNLKPRIESVLDTEIDEINEGDVSGLKGLRRFVRLQYFSMLRAEKYWHVMNDTQSQEHSHTDDMDDIVKESRQKRDDGMELQVKNQRMDELAALHTSMAVLLCSYDSELLGTKIEEANLELETMYDRSKGLDAENEDNKNTESLSSSSASSVVLRLARGLNRALQGVRLSEKIWNTNPSTSSREKERDVRVSIDVQAYVDGNPSSSITIDMMPYDDDTRDNDIDNEVKSYEEKEKDTEQMITPVPTQVYAQVSRRHDAVVTCAQKLHHYLQHHNIKDHHVSLHDLAKLARKHESNAINLLETFKLQSMERNRE